MVPKQRAQAEKIRLFSMEVLEHPARRDTSAKIQSLRLLAASVTRLPSAINGRTICDTA
jgi:hypothetical protein